MAFISAPGPLELMVILVIALIVLGPKRLPEAARSVGRGIRELRDSMQAPDPYDDDERGRELDDPYDEDDEDDEGPYEEEVDEAPYEEAGEEDEPPRGEEEERPHDEAGEPPHGEGEGEEPVATPRRGTADHS